MIKVLPSQQKFNYLRTTGIITAPVMLQVHMFRAKKITTSGNTVPSPPGPGNQITIAGAYFIIPLTRKD